MPKSWYVLVIIIGFSLGIFFSSIAGIDQVVVYWLMLLTIITGFMFWPSRFVRLYCFGLLAVLVGLVYPYMLGRERLVNLDQNFILVEWLMRARLAFVMAIQRVVPEPEASLAAGLVFGVGQGFPRELKQAFINTGTIHIVAVSGFNVTIILRLFSDWLRPLGRWVAFIAGTLAIIAFLIIVGGQASVVRAGIMGWLFLLARVVFRPFHIRNALFIAGFFMILFEPKILREDIGFQLSFLAMLGLMYFSPLLKYVVAKIPYHTIVPEFIRAALIETLAAQIAVAFIIMAYFGRLSLIAPIPNILIVPMIVLPMFLTIGIGFLALFNIGFVTYLAIPLVLTLKYILGVVNYFDFPSASVELNKLSWPLVTVLYAVMMLITHLCYRKVKGINRI